MKSAQLFILTILVLGMLATYIIITSLCHVPKDEQIMTALISAVALCLSFWFGSTNSSQKKDETIAAMTTPPASSTTNIIQGDAKV